MAVSICRCDQGSSSTVNAIGQTWGPRAWEADETRESQTSGQSGIHSKTLSQEKKMYSPVIQEAISIFTLFTGTLFVCYSLEMTGIKLLTTVHAGPSVYCCFVCN